jgi:O-antigen/teichoic acid export membrane protein
MSLELCTSLSRTPASDALCPISGPETGDSLSAENMRSGLYLAGRYGLGVIVSLGNMLVMTWWIGPHAYGLFVTAIGIVTFLAAVARGGVDTYLVRSRIAPDTSMYGTAATLILSASIALGMIAAAATPLLIRWYGNGEFVGPYLVLLLTVPIAGLTGVPMAKLERALDFRNIAAIELAGQTAGLLVAALLAWSRAGVWAPVMGQIAWQMFTLVASVLAASMTLCLRFDRRRAGEMLSFGIGLTASLRTWQLRTLVNPLLVGRFGGADAVAFVALALRIAEAFGTIRLAAGRMAIAALGRLQGKQEQFRKTLERALYLQVITLGPLLCGFALLGPFVLPRVAGARWMPSLMVYPFVAAGVLVNSVYNLQASALFVIGKQWIVMQAYTVHVALLALTTLVLLPRFGIVGYGWAEVIACASYFAIHAGLRRSMAISYRQLAPSLVVFLPCLFLIPISGLVLRIAR